MAIVREIELGCGAVAWMFARTRVPRATLDRHPWLATHRQHHARRGAAGAWRA
jgi:hypothetical protein